MDNHFFSAPLKSNLPVLLGLIGVWNTSFLGHNTRTILPYAQCLVRFAAHIQQVSMESNGKRVAMDGTVLPYETGEVVFGEPGTNGQHSFYQLLHQVLYSEALTYCMYVHQLT
jgi:glucose-6-phosphate isomerase